jgi:hypothetical protein
MQSEKFLFTLPQEPAMNQQPFFSSLPSPLVEHCDVSITAAAAQRESPAVVRGTPDPAHAADRRSPETEPAAPSVEHDNSAAEFTSAGVKRRRPKLDAVAKTRICDFVSVGKTIAEAARLVGVSERAVYNARRSDPAFKQLLYESYEDATLVCMKTMKQRAADGDRKAAMDYWKALEPERFDRRARVEQRAEKMIDEFRRCVTSIMTDEQLEELDRRLNSPPQKRR